MIPKRRTREKMGVRHSSVIRCQGHLAFVRNRMCAINGKTYWGKVPPESDWAKLDPNMDAVYEHDCSNRIEAAHVRIGTDGGIGMKPSDCWTIPLCSSAHREQHKIGEAPFEKRYGIDMKKIAADLWRISPHGIKYRKAREGTES